MEGLFEGLTDAPAAKVRKVKPVILTPPSTREAWLMEAASLMHPWLVEAGAGPRPKYRISVGWPLGGRATPKKGGGSHRIGECFSPGSSKDGTSEIFISPLLEEPTLVLGTLLHELVHAYVGVKARHGPMFRKPAVALGLEGKMTATVVGAALMPKLVTMAAKIGEFPHKGMTVGENPLKPKQTTRMLKVECPACGYTLRTSAKWIEVGLPTCVCGTKMESDAAEDDDE